MAQADSQYAKSLSAEEKYLAKLLAIAPENRNKLDQLIIVMLSARLGVAA